MKMRKLSRAENKLLEEIYNEFGQWDRFNLGRYTKKLPEYNKTSKRVLTQMEELLEHIFGKEGAKRVENRLEEKAYLDIALNQ